MVCAPIFSRGKATNPACDTWVFTAPGDGGTPTPDAPDAGDVGPAIVAPAGRFWLGFTLDPGCMTAGWPFGVVPRPPGWPLATCVEAPGVPGAAGGAAGGGLPAPIACWLAA